MVKVSFLLISSVPYGKWLRFRSNFIENAEGNAKVTKHTLAKEIIALFYLSMNIIKQEKFEKSGIGYMFSTSPMRKDFWNGFW